MTQKPYTPINCSLHDELLSFATLRKECTIIYRDEKNNEVSVNDIIEDVYSKEKEEFLRLRNGIAIRLDTLIKINGTVCNQ